MPGPISSMTSACSSIWRTSTRTGGIFMACRCRPSAATASDWDPLGRPKPRQRFAALLQITGAGPWARPSRGAAMNDVTTPWIDPELIAAGKLLQEKGLVAPDRSRVPLSEVRAAQERTGAFLGEGSVPLQDERDLSLPGPHGQVPCRLYLPDGVATPPLLVYAHGGGFMQGSLDSWDHFLRELVRQSGAAALSVDYKLSPEVKFPVAFEEMAAIAKLAAREGAGFGIDPSHLALGGDSAGANLALATALAMRDAGERAYRFQLLIY